MTDLNKQELRRLAEAANAAISDIHLQMIAKGANRSEADAIVRFHASANPAYILSLLDELEQAQMIGRISCNFDGYKSVLDERDQLRAEVEALRKDAERYRTYRLGFVSPAMLDESIDKAISTCGGLGCCQLCADEKAGEVGNGQG